MAKKPSSLWVCKECGYTSSGYYGKCPQCNTFGSIEERVESMPSPKGAIKSSGERSEKLSAISKDTLKRLNSGIMEFDRVVGNGVVSDSINIISAPPGMGKSTLLLQVANEIAKKHGTVIYVSGEESKSQVKNRADRILSSISDNLLIRPDTMIESILDEVNDKHPVLLIIDSLQMLYSRDCDGVIGGDKQAMACVNQLISSAKLSSNRFAVFIVGQMTKEDELRGSREIEHAVDGVFYIDRVATSPVRMFRASKNRFGNADEVGMFEMNSYGMEEISDPAHYFTSLHTTPQIGSALSVIKEGTRGIVIETEALFESNNFSFPQRISTGISNDQLKILLAIMENQIKIGAANKNIYVQVCGGLKIKSPSVQLATCVAIYSVLKNVSIPQDTIFIGEIGLTGYVKKISDIESVIKDCERFGFKTIIIPDACLPLREKYKIKIIPIKTIGQLASIL